MSDVTSALPDSPVPPVSLQLSEGRGQAGLSRLNIALRVIVAAALVTGAVLLVIGNGAVRAFEAALTSIALRPIAGEGSFASNQTFFVWMTPEKLQGFTVTVECTMLVILVPLLLLAAVMLAFARVRWHRFALATAAMIAIVLVTNLCRLVLIGWAGKTYGMDVGFPIAHTFVGSVIGICGFALALFALLKLSGAKRRRKAVPA